MLMLMLSIRYCYCPKKFLSHDYEATNTNTTKSDV